VAGFGRLEDDVLMPVSVTSASQEPAMPHALPGAWFRNTGSWDDGAPYPAGNNNAYCQDNEITWFDWSEAGSELLAFTRRLVAFRAIPGSRPCGQLSCSEVRWPPMQASSSG
jgi:hypothetical protein